MFFVEIKRANAFFQGQERFVNFCAIQFCLFVRVHRVGSSLTACQIYEADLAVKSTVVFKHHLHDGMGAGTLCVGTSRATGSQTHACLQSLHDGLHVGHLHLCQVDNVHLLLAVLSALHDLAIVEQIVQLAAVDFVERDVQFEVRIHVQVLNDVVSGK